MEADLSAGLEANGKAITVHEADWVLWSTDASDNVLGQIAAGNAERIALNGEFAHRALHYQGAKWSGEWHEDESHSIEIFRPVLLQAMSGRQAAINLPTPQRNQRCALVTRWWDAQAAVWWKRSYFGVTQQPAKVDGDGGHIQRQAMHAELRMRAERMAESKGSGTLPAMNLLQAGAVVWINGSETLTLYTYDGGFAPVDPSLLAGRAQIVQGADECLIQFAGVTRLRASEDGVHVSALDGSGPTYGTANPRLEFWVNAVRRCTLGGDGTLTTPSLTDANPGEDSAMLFTDMAGRLLLGIGATVTAPSFSDDL